jgi:hypothetical protein
VAHCAFDSRATVGFQNFEPSTIGKWLVLLKEIAPGVRRVGVVYDQSIPANVEFLHTAQAASRAFPVGIESEGFPTAVA